MTPVPPEVRDDELVRMTIESTPERVWSWEQNPGFRISIQNDSVRELADAATLPSLRYTADLYELNGEHKRRVAFEALPATIEVGTTETFTISLPFMVLGGDYDLRVGIEHVDRPNEAIATAPDRRIHLDNPIFEAFVELVSVCNFACTFCPQPEIKRSSPVMDIELAKKVVRDLADMGHHHPIRVHLLGEPLLYPHFLEFVDYAHSIGQCISLTTNGSRFKPETVGDLFRPGLAEVMVSLNTPGEELFDAQRGTKMTYDAYLVSVGHMVREAARRGGPPKTMIQVLFDQSKATEPSEIEKANRIIHEWATIAHDAAGDRALPIREIERFEPGPLTAIPLSEGLELQFAPYHSWGEGPVQGNHFCSFPNRQLAILSTGQATACCVDAAGEIHLGDATVQSVSEIWNGEPVQRMREAFWKDMKAVEPRCQRCNVHHPDLAELYR